MLNGKPYFMRGSNVTLYRFFEDAARGDLPWREDWVRTLHRRFKEMHWNSLRYCIGFPPEAWYRIADEEGFLIQDEFPIWNMSGPPRRLRRGRAGRPSTASGCRSAGTIPASWSGTPATRPTRPTPPPPSPRSAGWTSPIAPGTTAGARGPRPPTRAKSTPTTSSTRTTSSASLPATAGRSAGNRAATRSSSTSTAGCGSTATARRPRSPKTCTGTCCGANSTTAQRRRLYARYLAAETEFWRCRRACAAVMHFCAWATRRADGQTSDHWLDVAKLTWEPEFYRYVRDAFAPVGLMIEAWDEAYPAGKPHKFPVIVINDLPETWKGAVRVRVLRGAETLAEQKLPAEVAGFGSSRLVCDVPIPEPARRLPARSRALETPAGEVRSLRDFAVR